MLVKIQISLSEIEKLINSHLKTKGLRVFCEQTVCTYDENGLINGFEATIETEKTHDV